MNYSGKSLLYHVANHIMINTCIINNVSMKCPVWIFFCCGKCVLPACFVKDLQGRLSANDNNKEKRREECLGGLG